MTPMDEYNVNLAMPGYVGPVELVDEALDSCASIIKQAVDLAKQQRFSEGIELLEKSAERNPRWTPLYQLLTQLYLDTKQPALAQKTILRLHELGHQSPEFSVMLGTVWLRKRQFAEAILCFREARVLGAPAGEWLMVLAEALLRTGRLVEAEAILEDLRESARQERSRLFINLSTIRLQQRRFQEAVNFALEALREKPAKVRAFFLLGLGLMRKGEHEGALRAFEEYATRQPQRVAPYHFLERIARNAGDDTLADGYNLKAREILENRRLLKVEKQRVSSEIRNKSPQGD